MSRVIIFIYLIVATLYAINTPKWQTPDEPAHFNYIRATNVHSELTFRNSGLQFERKDELKWLLKQS